MQPTYFVCHPDNSFTVANPQPVSHEEYDNTCTQLSHLQHDYHHITQRVKDLLEALDKVSPDVEGHFEPINNELCELRDWIKDMMI